MIGLVFDWLQSRLGFGRGCSGRGCGVIPLILFVLLACGIITDTNWLDIGF